MSGIIGSKFNHRGSGLVGSLGTDGQHMLSSGAGKKHVFETVTAGVSAADMTATRQDVLTLALKQAVQENSTKFNLTNSAICKFEADADFNLAGSTTIARNASEYIFSQGTAAVATATSFLMGSNHASPWDTDGNSITIDNDGKVDISDWEINSESAPDADDAYGVSIDIGADTTLTTPLRWIPDGQMAAVSGTGSGSAVNAGICSINFGTATTSGWQFGSGGITPTVTEIGSFVEWTSTAGIYNQSHVGGKLKGYYNPTADNYPNEYVQYAWASGTATGRYLIIGMNPTNGVFEKFTMTDGGGNLFAPTITVSATGTALGTTNVPTSAVTDVSGVMLLKNEEGTATLGTDVKAYFTADNSNWTEADSYTDAGTFSTGIKMIKLGKTTCTSGSDVRWKIEFANQSDGSLETFIYGIGLNY